MRKIIYFLSIMIISLSLQTISVSASTFKFYDVPDYVETFAKRELWFSYSSFLDYYVIGRTVFESDKQLRLCFLNDDAITSTNHKTGSGSSFSVNRSSFNGHLTAQCYIFEQDSLGIYSTYKSTSDWSNLSFNGSYVTNYHDKKVNDNSSNDTNASTNGLTLDELKPYFLMITIAILLIFLAIEFKRRR